MDPDLDDEDDEKQTPLLRGGECQCKCATPAASKGLFTTPVTGRGYLGRCGCMALLALICATLSFLALREWSLPVKQACDSEQIELRIAERQRDLVHTLSSVFVSTVRAEMGNAKLQFELLLEEALSKLLMSLNDMTPRPYDMYDHGVLSTPTDND